MCGHPQKLDDPYQGVYPKKDISDKLNMHVFALWDCLTLEKQDFTSGFEPVLSTVSPLCDTVHPGYLEPLRCLLIVCLASGCSGGWVAFSRHNSRI